MGAIGFKGDSDDWAITRAAQLRHAGETCAQIVIRGTFPKMRCGVRRADGSIEWQPRPRSEPEHTGMDGKPCQCTKHRRTNARRGCAPTCFCHGLKHSKCPNAKPCIGGCGRLTTSGETSACGYCAHCAADSRWVEISDAFENGL